MHARGITRHIPEQLELLRPFEDPIEFVVLYVAVYERQLGVSTKIIAGSLPHYAAFHAALVDHILRLALLEPLASRSLDGLTAVLTCFRAREFYDCQFYSACAAALTKGTNVLLDRAQSEILASDYTNAHILYRFSLSQVDLSGQLVSRFVSLLGHSSPRKHQGTGAEADNIQREALSRSLKGLWDDIQQINGIVSDVRPSEVLVAAYNELIREETTQGGSPVDGEDDLFDEAVADAIVKTKLSGLLVGTQRVTFYRFETVAPLAADAYKSLQHGLPGDEAYNNIMLFCDVVSAFNNTERLVEEMQEHAKYLLAADAPDAIA